MMGFDTDMKLEFVYLKVMIFLKKVAFGKLL